MKQTVTESMFRDAFRDIRPDNFSYAALGELFKYYEQLEEDIGEEIELDVIAICCDWGEYTLEELRQEYGYMVDPDDIEFMGIEDWIEFLGDHPQVIKVTDSYSIPGKGINSLLVGTF